MTPDCTTGDTDGPMRQPDVGICALEPIHIPGAIQPHGAILAARVNDLRVTHASANLGAIAGIAAEAALGRPLQEILGAAALACIPARGGYASGHADCQAKLQDVTVNLRGHCVGQLICIDIEPEPEPVGAHPPVGMVQSLVETFQHASTRFELCELAVRGLKILSGYDRVMAYRFDASGDGEVVAEVCNPGMEPYRGLRYPASDIPPQARRQSLQQPVCVIADSHYQPVPVLSHPILHDGTPMDMTRCTLRSISPAHLEYMRNMNVRASLTVGLAHHQALWGMLVCHHGTPRAVGNEMRAAAAMIGQIVSLLLASLGQTEVYAQRIERLETLRSLVDKLAAPVPLNDALAAAEVDLLTLVNADGAIVRVSGSVRSFGRTPPTDAALRALDVLHQAATGKILALDDLGVRHPGLSACTKDGSGALLLPLSKTSDDAILWFRPELSRDVLWGGDPSKPATADPLTGRISPRRSFAAWKQIVRGRSAPWHDADMALVRELRDAIDAETARRTEVELARLRHYDFLTDLPNRRLFQERLEQALARAQRDGVCVALFYLDLDHFKQINDLLGHPSGDAALRTVADRLRGCMRSSDTLARLGGDEFGIIQPTLVRMEDATAFGRRLIEAVEPPMELGGEHHHVGLSIGIAVSDTGAASRSENLMKQADIALYCAKGEGRGQVRCFTPDMDAQLQARRALESDLRMALAEDRLTLFYQPQVDLVTERIVGAEALLRWNHPTRGMVPPGHFIALAEDTGLIIPIGVWVLREACRRAVTWPESIGLAVNVSPRQLRQADFCEAVIGLIEETGITPSRLELEITEGVLMQGTEQTLAILKRLSEFGIKLVMDDFGTGYSSLGYLLKFRFDKIKIDRSFIARLGKDPHAEAIVAAVVGMTQALGAGSVAEGVETSKQAHVLRSLGCAEAQGHLYNQAMRGETFDLLVRPHGDKKPASC